MTKLTFQQRCQRVGLYEGSFFTWLDKVEQLTEANAGLTKTNLEQVAQLEQNLEEMARLDAGWRDSNFERFKQAQIIERQAAQIEMLRDALKTCQLIKINFPDSEQTHQMVFNSKVVFTALTTTPAQALEAFAAKVREQAAKLMDLRYSECLEPEIREAAEAIRNLKGLP